MQTNKATSTKSSSFKLQEIALVKNNLAYCRYLNWVIGEFDLFLKNEESKALKVFFPNGWFSISCIQNSKNDLNVALNVEGKSEVACQTIMNQLKQIYKHVCDLHD